MDAKRRVLRDSAIYIEENRIVEVGETQGLKSKYRPDKILGGKRKIVMPGFANCHDHTFITIFRQLGDDLNLFDWFAKNVAPIGLAMDPDDAYQSARLCFAEQIRSGITTAVDDSVPWFRNSIGKEVVADKVAKAATEAGSRVIQAIGGADLRQGLGPAADILAYEPEKAKMDAINLIKRYNESENENVRIWTNSSWPPVCTPEMYKAMKQVADDYRTFTYSHIAEAQAELQISKQAYGKTPVEFLDSVGFLDTNTLLAHAVWLNDEDIARLKKSGTKVSHQPICNQYLASGFPPIPKMLSQGITIGLGIDDGGHMNEDFFGLMKSCALMHKVHALDATVMTAEKVLEMATIDGARAVGMEAQLGSLEPGKIADLIVIDYSRLNLWPPLRPWIDLVYGGMETDVETTIINGKVVMEDRRLTFVDEPKLLEETEKTAWNLIDKAKAWDLVNKTALGWQVPRKSGS